MSVLAIFTATTLLFALSHWLNEFITKRKMIKNIYGLSTLKFFAYLLRERDAHKALLKIVFEHKSRDITCLQAGRYFFVNLKHPDNIRVLFNHKKLQIKSDLYDLFKPLLGDGLLSSSGKIWKENQKDVVPSFRSVPLEGLLPIIFEEAEIFVQMLHREDGREFPVLPHVNRVMLSCVLRTSIDVDLNIQRNASPFIDRTEEFLDIQCRRVLVPDVIFKLTSLNSPLNEAIRVVKEFLVEVKRNIKENIQEMGNHETNNKFIYNYLSKPNVNIDRQTFHDNLATILGAGFDTLGSTFSYALSLLGQNQYIQQRIYEEDQDFQNKFNKKPVSLEDLDEYEYTERVIKETMRLFPVGPYLPREATDDIQLDFGTIPKGSTVMAFISLMHRDPRFFPFPEEFNPDNFLPEHVANRHPYAFLPFSAGPRTCLAPKYAMAVMKVLLPAVVRNFRIFSKGTVQTLTEDIKVSMLPKDSNGNLVTMKKREPGDFNTLS